MSVFKEKNDDYPTHTMTWSEAWTQAITDPSDQTYEAIITDPQATAGRAFGWAAAAAAVAAIVSAFGATLVGSDGGGFAALLCAVPFAAVLAVIGLLIGGGIVNLIAKAIGGTGTFDELINGMAAVSSPVTIISSVLTLIPSIGTFISGLLFLYSIYLSLKVTKVVHQFGWGKAIAANFAIVFLFACAVVCVLTLIGGEISDVFADIQATLEAG